MTPAPSRTIQVGAPIGVAPMGYQSATPGLIWPNKSAIATLDYSADFTQLLDDSTDSITMADVAIAQLPAPAYPPGWSPAWAGTVFSPPWGGVSVTPPPTPSGTDVSAVSTTVAGALVTLMLTAGIPTVSYGVTITAQTAAGRTLACTVQIYVDPALGTPTTPADDALTVAGLNLASAGSGFVA